MSRADLVRAYFTHPSVMVYLGLAAASLGVVAATAETAWPSLAAAAVTAVIYPLAEYAIHRFVLHGRYMYKLPFLAATWKRVHYDHHQDPNDLRVLFGALYTTLPTIALVALPVGGLVGGLPGAAAAFATALLAFAFYEFCHCAQHLNYRPKSEFLRRIKQRHMAHHFHDESGNFGITSFLWDRVFGTLYESPKERPRSPTAFNLGYTEEEARRYPWVAELSRARGDGRDPALARRRPGGGRGGRTTARDRGGDDPAGSAESGGRRPGALSA